MISSFKKIMLTFIGSSIVVMLGLFLVFLIIPRYDYTGAVTEFLTTYKTVILLFCFSFVVITVARLFYYHPVGRGLTRLLLLRNGSLVMGTIGHFVFDLSIPTLVTFFLLFASIWFLFLLEKLIFRLLMGFFLGGSICSFIFFQIPIYTAIVSTDTIMDYQPYHFTILGDSTKLAISYTTTQNTTIVVSGQTFTTVPNQTIRVYEHISSFRLITQGANEFQMRILFPDQAILYLSHDAFVRLSGMQLTFLQGTGFFVPGSRIICQLCSSTGILLGEQNMESSQDAYFSTRYQTARELYKRNLTDSDTLEKGVYRKLRLGSLFFPQTYVPILTNFLAYRYVLGKDTFGYPFVLPLFVPSQVQNNTPDDKSPNLQPIRDGSQAHALEGLQKTRYFKWFLE